MLPSISVKGDICALSRDLAHLARQQIPYATALTVNAVAREVIAAETDLIRRTFDNPTPFTLRAFELRTANKANPTARILIRDRQALYLAPYIEGGRQVLYGKKGMLTPADIPLNPYGNLPRGKLRQLKGKPDVFIGRVKTRGGADLAGVWRRPKQAKVGRRHRGMVQPRGHLELLVVFTDPKLVRQHFAYVETARAVVARELPRAWQASLARALSTAR